MRWPEMRWRVKIMGSCSVGWWAVGWLATAGLALAQTEIKVNTDRVNLRAKASLEAEAVGQVAEVFCNGGLLATHKGGYATFFVDLTDSLAPGENVIAVCADNQAEHIYPQMADFTFFGGIYRPVTLLILEGNHFSLEKSGSDGVFVTPGIDGSVRVDAFVSGGDAVTVTLLDQLGRPVAQGRAAPQDGHAAVALTVAEPHRWQGVKDPYLYSAVVALDESDELTIRFGFRDFSVDPELGFFLNGVSTPLRGVSRCRAVRPAVPGSPSGRCRVRPATQGRTGSARSVRRGRTAG